MPTATHPRLYLEELRQILTLTAAALLTLLAWLVFARRLSGALAEPAPWPWLLLAGTMVGGARVLIHTTCRSSAWQRIQSLAGWLDATTLTAAILLGLCLIVPGTGGEALVALWLPGLVAEGLVRWRYADHPLADQAAPAMSPAQSLVEEEAADPEIMLSDESITQHVTRSLAAGTDSYSGWLRVPFAAGQRTGQGHLAFCPPFSQTPQVEFYQADGPEGQIKLGEVLPHGCRFDLRLMQPAEDATSLAIEFVASAPAPAASSPPKEPPADH